MKTLRSRWVRSVVGVGLVGTLAMCVAAISVSLYCAQLTAREWLTGEGVKVRHNFDQQLLEGFTVLATEGAIDLDAEPQADLGSALQVAGHEGRTRRAPELIGVVTPAGVMFSRALRCAVPEELRAGPAMKAVGADGYITTWPVRFLCSGVPAMGIAARASKPDTIVIAGQLLDDDYAEAVARMTQLEVAIVGDSVQPASTFRDLDGARLAPRFPSEPYGRTNLTLPHYGGYRGAEGSVGKGRSDVDFYYAAVDLDAKAFPGAKLVFAIPSLLVMAGSFFTAAALFATMVLVLAAMALIARRLAKRTTGPVVTLASLSHKVTEGDLDVQMPPIEGSVVELDELRSSFNRMVTSLKDMKRRVYQTEKMAAVGQLSASVAHEINNPLAYIIGNLSFAIERRKAGEPMEDSLEESLEGAKRIAQIVRDLKTFSRAEEAEAETRVDVETLLDSAVKMAGNRIRHKARLLKNYSAASEVMANPGRLAQVFLNLLVNASDAIEPGRAEQNQILLKLEQRVGEVVVEITDTGSGMPDSVRKRLFEPFFTTKPIGVGTGLGLSICKNILEAAGGSIAILTGPAGRGTMVRVKLPVAAHESVVTAPKAVAKPSTEPAAKKDAPRLLVIDDDPGVLRSIRRMLEPAYAVTTVPSASEALERLGRGERFDLLICDLMMPEVTGIELHQHLRRAAPLLSERMLFITGGAFTPDAGEFMDQVRPRVIEKPIGPALLRSAVDKALASFAVPVAAH